MFAVVWVVVVLFVLCRSANLHLFSSLNDCVAASLQPPPLLTSMIVLLQAMQQLSACLDPKLLAQFGGKKG